MKDGYFYKSLFLTLLVYLVLLSVLVSFVVKAGIFGISFILILIVMLFAYYYHGLFKTGKEGKT